MKLLDLLKSSGGEESLRSRLGVWRQRVSEELDALLAAASGIVLPGGGVLPPATLAALSTFGSFYALMAPDNASTILPGAPMLFPQDGPRNGVTRNGASTSQFVLPAVGVYEVSWQVSITEAAQLALDLNGVLVADTVAGRATGTNQLMNDVVITTTTPNSLLRVINPGLAALTITPNAGGSAAHPVSAWLVVKRLG